MGVYLSYPLNDLMCLTALEAFRHGAVVIAEDLGTVPHHFRAQLAQTGFSGMRVLWFERDGSGAFMPPGQWSPDACALPTTHDLPTLAGWWRERDIDWRSRLSPNTIDERKARREREADRRRLWKSLKRANCVQGRRPPRNQPQRMVEGALRYVAKSSCSLSLFPLEDITASVEQPNLPGTVGVHPNWRRRFSSAIVHDRQTQQRLALISEQRSAR
jgi:4-alpha-glucanotransferase